MNLYEINAKIMECVDEETGEVIDEESLDALEMEREQKIENIALWIKNLLSDAEAIKAEKNALYEREKHAKNKAESLKRYLARALAGSKFQTPRVAVSFRNSLSVEADVYTLMGLENSDKYLRYPEPAPDKAAIKEALKSGVEVPGCSLVEKRNIQIK